MLSAILIVPAIVDGLLFDNLILLGKRKEKLFYYMLTLLNSF